MCEPLKPIKRKLWPRHNNQTQFEYQDRRSNLQSSISLRSSFQIVIDQDLKYWQSVCIFLLHAALIIIIIRLAQDRDRWLAVVSAVMNLRFLRHEVIIIIIIITGCVRRLLLALNQSDVPVPSLTMIKG
jgi:hypothetical protein